MAGTYTSGGARADGRGPLAVRERVSVSDDGECARLVFDVPEVVAELQVGEGHRADRGTLAGLRQRVRPQAEAGLGVVCVTALLGAADGDVGERGVLDRVLRLAAHVVRLEHDSGVCRVGDV